MRRNYARLTSSLASPKRAASVLGVLVLFVAAVGWSQTGGTRTANGFLAPSGKAGKLIQAVKSKLGTTKASTPAPEARVTQAVDDTQTVTLVRNTRPEANSTNDRGRVADDQSYDHILMVLQRSPAQEAALNLLYAQLNDRSSPNFHKWLTAEQFGQRFGVSDQDIAAVTSWLQSNGFHVNRVYPGKMTIDFGGTAASIRKGFHTEIHNLNVNGEAHISNMSDPQIPVALAPVIKGIFSLNDFKPHADNVSARQYTFTGCTGATGTGHCYGITPSDNQAIYNLYPLYNAGISGQGQTIVLAEDTDTYGTAGSNGASDWNTYRSTFGLSSAFPAGSYSQAHPGGCTDPGTNADDGEAAIDVEVASAIAPSAAIELISCPSATFTFGGLIAVNNLINEGGSIPTIVSVSYGLCEVFTGSGGNASFNTVYQQAAMEGVSVFASSGDEGPSSCSNLFGTPGSEYDESSLGVTGWGESQYVVSVGGTDFEDVYNAKEFGTPLSNYWDMTNDSTQGSALQYIPEIPWNDACASILISNYVTGSYVPYGASPATCNNSAYDTASTFLSTGAASGGASNCYTGTNGSTQTGTAGSTPECQGYPKPTFQTGAALMGGQAVYGSNNDGVRDIPDVSMFAANGVWGHYEIVCWSDPAETADGAAPCTGAVSGWAGFGGTSVASPTMAAVQALVQQKTGQSWGNPDPIYYQIGQDEYGVAGGTFLGGACNASVSGGPASNCAFHDVTQGDINLACRDNGTTQESHCYKPAGTNGVDSTDVITAAAMINGGSGYTSAPTCTIAGPTNASPYMSPTNTTIWAGGTQATCTAGAPNAASTTSTWTVKIAANPTTWIASAPSVVIGGVTYQFVSTLTAANQVLVYTASTTSTNETNTAKNLEAAINANSAQCGSTAPCYGTGTVANPLATATESTSTDTFTAKTTGEAGNFSVAPGTTFIETGEVMTITNTVIGQGPNYIPSITISNGGSGYQPETPITLTGGGGSGAIAVANTSPATAPTTYQPVYGATPGYDLATGLGTPNATAFVNAPEWVTNNGNTPGIYSPVNGSNLDGNQETFYWNANASATAYWLDLGSTQGGNQYLDSGSLSSSTLSYTVSDLPTNGSAVWARWYYNIGGTWSYIDYSYTAAAVVSSSDSAATMSTPVPGNTLTGSSQTFTWTTGTGVTLYDLDIGSTAGGTQYYSAQTTSTSAAVTGLPTNGSTIYVTLYSKIEGTFVSNSYTYTAASSMLAQMTSPTPSTTLPGSSVTFQWSTGSGVTSYYLDVGTSANVNKYYSQNQGTNTSVTVTTIPVDGSTVIVTLYSLINGSYQNNQYTYTAFNAQSSAAVMSSPTPGSQFTGSSETFTWNAVAGAQAYYVDIGSTSGGNNYYSQNQGTNTSVTVSGLPTDGSQVYVTLYTQFNSIWYKNIYSYTAASFTLAVMSTPSPGSPLPGPSATFTWTTGNGPTAYYLDIGSSVGGNQYYSMNEGTATTATVNSLPLDGSTVYVTLYSYLNSAWQANHYTYTAAQPAAITSPPPNTTLSGASQTFNWNAGVSATEYWIDIGTTSMGNDLYSQDQGTNQTVTVGGLPTDGSTIYVTLYTKIQGQWYNNGSVSYTTGP
jgi:Pro-kumamolisin, activation domain